MSNDDQLTAALAALGIAQPYSEYSLGALVRGVRTDQPLEGGLLGLGATPLNQLLGIAPQIPPPPRPIKHKVFISYHHAGDQWWYDKFAEFFAETYEVFSDKSLQRAYDSDNDAYARFQIRSNDIKGSSCTIVLCGAATHQRKYVDWEIKATLDMRHGLIGVWLPTLPPHPNGGTDKPARLQDNIDSRYAKSIRWDAATVDNMKATIEAALASPAILINNSRPLRQRNS